MLQTRLFHEILLIILVCILVGCKSVFAAVGDIAAEENRNHGSQEVTNSEWRLVILPHTDNAANTLVRRIDDTLNLTCLIEHYDSTGNDTLSSPLNDYLFKLSWLLPIMQQNSKNRVSFADSPNALHLTMNNLKDADTGEYVCQAKSLTDANFSVAFTESIRLKVKPLKSTCSDPSFLCLSGECIAKRFLCDGKGDCNDRSDESTQQCGTSHPCEGKLRCDDNRCIAPHWCCDRSSDPNCTVRVMPSCCRQLPPPITVSLDVTQYSPQPQHYNDMGFLQTTIYTVIGCAMAFMFIITIMVIAICRVHLKRTAMVRYPHRMGQSSQRHDSWGNIFLHSGMPYTSAASGLLVTYNINNGVQFVGRPVNPPPYSEIVRLPPREGPPPPYASVENLTSASAASSSNSQSSPSQQSQNYGCNQPRNIRDIYILQNDPENLASLEPLLANDNNNGDINGNNTDDVQVSVNMNLEHDVAVVSSVTNPETESGRDTSECNEESALLPVVEPVRNTSIVETNCLSTREQMEMLSPTSTPVDSATNNATCNM